MAEVPAAKPPESFVAGIFTGLVVAGVLVHIWFAVLFARGMDMYAEFGDVAIPGVTRLVLSRAWLFGLPVIGAALAIGLIARRPRRLGPYIATALLLAMAATMTWHFSQAPLTAAADNIQSE